MKFSLFAHMERMSPEQPHEALYEDFLSLCTMADQGGMHAVWTGEAPVDGSARHDRYLYGDRETP